MLVFELLLSTAISIVRQAAKVIEYAANDLTRLSIEEKQQNPTNLVTSVDLAVERDIIESIRKIYPGDLVMGEEGDQLSREEALKQEGRVWVIDPIDGTSNFIHGFPHYAIALACMQQGRVNLGVVMNAANGELFSAERGLGATRETYAMRVSGRTQLRGALLANSSHPSPDSAFNHDNLATYQDLYSHSLTIRRTGSSALDLAYVASGRLDGFWGMGLELWDLAAGGLLVREAGGMISDYEGGEQWMQRGDIVCGTGRCFKEMLKIVRKHITR